MIKIKHFAKRPKLVDHELPQNEKIEDPFETASGFARKIKNNFTRMYVCCFTVSRRLNIFGLNACSPTTKPLISKKNKAARFTYAETHILWSESDWEKVHFSDKSKFNLVGSDGIQYVRRVTGDRLNPRCVKKSVIFGGGSVMAWDMFSSEGVGPLVRINRTVNANVYRNILEL